MQLYVFCSSELVKKNSILKNKIILKKKKERDATKGICVCVCVYDIM